MLIPLKHRRKTRTATIGSLKLGHNYPVAIQSMCSTKTEDIEATVAQIKRLEAMDCALIRLAIPTMETAKALEIIKSRITIPVVADIHFDARLAIASMERGADKIRINPGNIVANFNPNEKPTQSTRLQIEMLDKILATA
ncbi:MAG: 4-hydroxy-3-methylbut-2-en-1-yl diphosphate synthase, partial [uncultured bacterium]